MGDATDRLLLKMAVSGRTDLGIPVVGTVKLAATGPCSLGHHGKHGNWITKVHGHLPNYVCHIAKAILRSGKMDESHAIATALGAAKKWSTGHHGGLSRHGVKEPARVHPQTQARATEAVGEWEALKAKAHAHHDAKDIAHHVSALDHGFKDHQMDSRDEATKARGENDET